MQNLNPEELDRLPPHDLDAERGVLGSVLLAPERLEDVALLLRSDDFYQDAHQKLYRRLCAMHDADRQIDLALLVGVLKEASELEVVGGTAYLATLMQSVPVAAHAVHYAKAVARQAVYRRLIHVGTELVRAGYAAHEQPAELLDRAEAQLAEAKTTEHDGKPRKAGEAAVEALCHMEAVKDRRQAAGYLTGLESYDRNFGGLFPGELVILAGRPGKGKTSLGCQMAYHFALQGRGVYFASLEMSAEELVTRVMASRAQVSVRRIRTGQFSVDDYDLLSEAARPLASAPWWIHDRPSLTTTEIRRAARRLQRHGLCLVIVDYLQRLTPVDRSVKRHEQVGRMSDALKQLARELDVPVLCLCQLNREATKEKKAPDLHHLRESGSIEQDADVVMFLHVKGDEPRDHHEPVHVELLVRKNRNGETGCIDLEWIRAWTKFRPRMSWTAPPPGKETR